MDNKTVVLSFLNAADHGDVEAVEKLFGPRHLFYTTMSPEPMNTAQHLGMMQALNNSFSNTRHEILDAFDAGKKVVVRGVWHGMHTADFNGIPASNNAVRLPFIIIADIENGEMVNQWLEMDFLTLMTQIGAIHMQEAAV